MRCRYAAAYDASNQGFTQIYPCRESLFANKSESQDLVGALSWVAQLNTLSDLRRWIHSSGVILEKRERQASFDELTNFRLDQLWKLGRLDVFLRLLNNISGHAMAL